MENKRHQCIKRGSSKETKRKVRSDLDQLGVVVRQLAVGELVSLDDPAVLEDLPGRQPLVGVHVEHLGHQVLEGRQGGGEVVSVKSRG